jgi:GxxExxY protein
MNSLAFEELTGRITGGALAVHRALGPCLLESVYENALVVELRHAGLRTESPPTPVIHHRGALAGKHRLDLRDRISVEWKAVSALGDVQLVIVRSYLKAAGLEHGLLLNCATAPLTVKRVVYKPNSAPAAAETS